MILLADRVYRIKVKDGDNEIEIAGDKRFVNKIFKEISVLLGKKIKGGRIPTKRRKKLGRKKKRGRKPKPKPKKITKKDYLDIKKMTLTELFEFRKPKRENQRVLLLAYYANKALKKREFRGKELKTLYQEIGIAPPKNLTYFLRKMAEDERGLLAHGRKSGRYKITDKGIDFIYNEIPKS